MAAVLFMFYTQRLVFNLLPMNWFSDFGNRVVIVHYIMVFLCNKLTWLFAITIIVFAKLGCECRVGIIGRNDSHHVQNSDRKNQNQLCFDNKTIANSSTPIVARIPSLATHDAILLLKSSSNRGMNLCNTNERRMASKQRWTVLLLIIIMGGDVQPNPGPVRYPCGMCSRPVASNHRGLECDECGYWVHIRCGSVTSKDYDALLEKGEFTWICPGCALPNFSDSFFEDTDLADDNLYDSLSDLEISGSNDTDSQTNESSSTKSKLDSAQHPQPKSNQKQTETDQKQRNKQKQKSRTKAKLKQRKLKIMTINCDGLKGKERQHFLATVIDEEKPDIMMGQESKLNNSYTDSEVFPEGYLVKRKDRSADGGGVFILYRENIIVDEVKGVGKDCELVMFKIQAWKTPPIYIGSFYRPPSRDPAPISSLHADLEKIYNQSRIPKLILAGDFNLPSINWDTCSVEDNPQYGWPVNNAMIELIEQFNLDQKVLKPTRKNNILDLILTTTPDCIHDVEVVPGMSDHEAVTALCDTNVQTNKKKPRTVHIYRKANMEGIQKDLSEFAEEFLDSNNTRNTSENWDFFKEALVDSMASHIPTKTISGRWNLPLMTDQIKRLIKKRKRKYNAWKKYGQQSDLAEYNQLKKEVSQALKRAHGEYVNNIFDNENGNSAKRLWGYVKALKMDRVGIPSLIWENRLVTIAKQKAEVLSQQYKSVFTVEDRSSMPTKGQSNVETMADINITTNGVEKLLNTLNPRKAVGPDQVSTWMLKKLLIPTGTCLESSVHPIPGIGRRTYWLEISKCICHLQKGGALYT